MVSGRRFEQAEQAGKIDGFAEVVNVMLAAETVHAFPAGRGNHNRHQPRLLLFQALDQIEYIGEMQSVGRNYAAKFVDMTPFQRFVLKD